MGVCVFVCLCVSVMDVCLFVYWCVVILSDLCNKMPIDISK